MLGHGTERLIPLALNIAVTWLAAGIVIAIYGTDPKSLLRFRDLPSMTTHGDTGSFPVSPCHQTFFRTVLFPFIVVRPAVELLDEQDYSQLDLFVTLHGYDKKRGAFFAGGGRAQFPAYQVNC